MRGVGSSIGRATIGVAALLCVLASAPPAVAGEAAWSNTLDLPDDPLIRTGWDSAPGWVKFLILTSAPGTVYFQDSNLYPFHYDFATQELPQFAGMTPEQFDAVTLHAAGQQAILGAVLVPPTANGMHVTPEYGIQIVREDAYSPFTALAILQTVASRVVADPGVQPFYMPTFEQLAIAQAWSALFESEGFPLSSTARWQDGNSCYAFGWAIGRLEFVPAGQIEAAFLSGQLAPDEVLLTDAVPAEIPLVAGVLTLAPTTPGSHVALLAQTFGVPFAFLAVEADAQKALALAGKRVFLRALDRYGACQVRIVDTEPELDPPTVDELLAFKSPPVLDVDAIEPYGAYSASTDGLLLSDVRYFGGKAAHSGLLRQAIPASSPVSAAFSFDLWSAFLDQTVTGGNTLRAEVAQRLAGFAYPPDVAALAAALDGIRDLFENDTAFAPALQTAVLATLQDARYGFDPAENLRFRSSTNVEDTESFTGAGLYDSFSGCLADDLDGNAAGPSACDPSEPDERGVFRAIRKVFASFYNLHAYLERLRHGVDESEVGMALLVHPSFEDADELANGVATYTRGPGATQRSAYLVLQPGANSVTNPEPGHVPEEVDVYISTGGSIWPTVVQPSNLVLLGETVLEMPGEYVALTQLLRAVAERYETVTGLGDFVLDYELKKTAPDGDLVVTQVRRVPAADLSPGIAPFLLNEPTAFCLFQGEGAGSVLATHRLKSRWRIETDSAWLTGEQLDAGFFGEVSVDFVEGCVVHHDEGALDGFPGYAHQYDGGTAIASWNVPDLQNPRAMRITVDPVDDLVDPAVSPVALLTDFGWPMDYTDLGCLQLRADYAAPVPDFDFDGTPIVTTTDYGWLCRCPPVGTSDVHVVETVTDGWVQILTSFYWPKPASVAAGYTAPLSRFVATTIVGLTSQPIVLHDPHAQTYKPGHHNFTSEFAFEPALDPDVPQALLDELDAAGVRVIYAERGFGPERIETFSAAEWGYHCLDCRGPDGDGDERCAFEPTHDCDDGDPTIWAVPGEVPALRFTSATLAVWDAPGEPGGGAPAYDLLRSDDRSSFLGATCVESGGADLSAPVPATPPSGTAAYFLVRAENACPGGPGTLGETSAGTERVGAPCP